jgi:hypothetical protein
MENKNNNSGIIKMGAWLTGLALPFGISPFVLALILAPLTCGANANEANCGAAVLPWFMFFTIPAGFVMFLVGIIMMIFGGARKFANRNDNVL